jgi:hypothetical protein
MGFQTIPLLFSISENCCVSGKSFRRKWIKSFSSHTQKNCGKINAKHLFLMGGAFSDWLLPKYCKTELSDAFFQYSLVGFIFQQKNISRDFHFERKFEWKGMSKNISCHFVNCHETANFPKDFLSEKCVQLFTTNLKLCWGSLMLFPYFLCFFLLSSWEKINTGFGVEFFVQIFFFVIIFKMLHNNVFHF